MVSSFCNQVKCNTDGTTKGSLGATYYGGILTENFVAILGFFAMNLGINNVILGNWLMQWRPLILLMKMDG